MSLSGLANWVQRYRHLVTCLWLVSQVLFDQPGLRMICQITISDWLAIYNWPITSENEFYLNIIFLLGGPKHQSVLPAAEITFSTSPLGRTANGIAQREQEKTSAIILNYIKMLTDAAQNWYSFWVSLLRIQFLIVQLYNTKTDSKETTFEYMVHWSRHIPFSFKWL